jgi:adenylate cyclase
MNDSPGVRRGVSWIHRLRLVTGLILATFLVTHLANHALGLVSLVAMETARFWFLALWRNALGTALLYGALTVHVALAFYSIYSRRSLWMPLWQAIQIIFGLMIPLFLISHIAGTRFAYEWFGVIDSYARLSLLYWVTAPAIGAKQVILLLIAWTHACIGIHYWLRLKSWYIQGFPLILSIYLLLAVLALAGLGQSMRETFRLSEEIGWIEEVQIATQAPGRAEVLHILRVRDAFWYGYVALLALVFLARVVRGVIASRKTVCINYPDGRSVLVPAGFSVLEASRRARIPHAGVCGARGRCSTCRVRISNSPGELPSPTPEERSVLERIGSPPGVRLACQLRPLHDISVTPVLPPETRAIDALAEEADSAGREVEIAVLFADLRGFTRLSENKLPYDVVFFLNRYFEVMGGVIDRAGGVVNQYTGDGVMALFGVEDGPEAGCRNALEAARGMVADLEKMSESLQGELLEEPLRMGVGIHCGPVVVGRMGRGVAMYLTAVGDTVHVASRFQDLTKEYACQLIISAGVAGRAGLDVSAFPMHKLTVRNRTEPIAIRTINDVRDI